MDAKPQRRLFALIPRMWGSAYPVAVLGTVIRVGANLLLLPLILRQLAPELQALWWVFLSLGALAGLTDLGFGHVISRVYGFLWAGAEDVAEEGLAGSVRSKEPNLPRLRVLNCTVRHLYFWVSVIATTLLLAGGTWVLGKQIGKLADPTSGWLAWAGYLTAVAYNVFTGHWVMACTGVNRVRSIHIAYTVGGVSYLVTAALLLHLGAGLLALVVATAARSFVTRSIAKRSYEDAVPPEKGVKVEVDLELLKRLWPNARKFGIMAFGAYLIGQANTMIASHTLPVEQIASYGLSVQAVAFLISFSNLWLSVKWPHITVLRTQGALIEMSELFARRLSLVSATFLMGALGLLFVGPALIDMIGARSNVLPPEQLVIYLLWAIQQVWAYHFGLLTFTENVVPFYRLSIFSGVVSVILSFALTHKYGIWGLLYAPLFAELTCAFWYVILRGFRGQPLSPGEFLRAFFWQRPIRPGKNDLKNTGNQQGN